MATSFHQWESDPLFSAAEVVQDSADRMESIFRLLLHEQGLVQGHHSDPKLLTSIEYHRRDLATTLETAKWQLEDFERAVSLSAATDKSRMREDVISRHKQFIRAIREQIVHVEKSLLDSSMGNSVRNTEWINLNEQDRDGLALFLSGQDPTEQVPRYEKEDSTILRRFLDPVTTSSYNDSTDEIVEQKTRESENLNMARAMHVDHDFKSSKEGKLRNVGSHYPAQLSFEAPEALRDTAGGKHGGDGSWDLEADGAKDKSFFHKDGRGYHNRMGIFCFLANLWPAYGSRVSRNFTKRLKDGEEQSHSPSQMDVSHGAPGHQARMRLAFRYGIFQGLCSQLSAKVTHSYSWIGVWRSRYQRSRYHIQADHHSVRMILMMLFALIVLGILLFQVA